MRALYILLFALTLLCASFFLFSLLSPTSSPHHRSPYIHAPGYYANSDSMGIVRVIPLAGAELESPCADAMPEGIVPAREE